ncbi:XRE family transcriptional regulator [Mediterraneibacter faecis]|uniref:XRE family transcriptional regulator n=1 Tax=Mediterraneibacter faecis TaxID=592978 RepID=UPI0032BFEA45
MINENIKHFRKTRGMSQEEMAVKLNVVRQTVSKWEKGLSIPDADVLIEMANLLDVSVSQLLGIEESIHSNGNLAEELAELNEQLARKKQKEKLLYQANQKRGLILFVSFLSMMITMSVKNEVVSILMAGICMLIAAIVLYRNLALFTSLTTDDLRIGIFRVTTLCNISILIIGIVFAFLSAVDVINFSENGEKLFAMVLLSCIMVFIGIVSPKLPYNRHTGLRLPWTVRDEDTWKIAHRILGFISFPMVLLYIACALTISDFEIVSVVTMLIWISIPGGISYIYYNKKLTKFLIIFS